jgi:hypothetical protein
MTRPHDEPAFTEQEIKDVVTALYQDGRVDLVLADRVAALLLGRAAAGDPPLDTATVWTGLMAGCAPAATDRTTTNSGDTGGPTEPS